MQKIWATLQMEPKCHFAHHPQSSGAVERKNSDFKTKLARIGAETGLKYLDVLLTC